MIKSSESFLYLFETHSFDKMYVPLEFHELIEPRHVTSNNVAF